MLWRSGSQVFTQIVSWCSTLIVIRLLAPQDYGLFAMASVMLVLLSTMNGWGLASALIREEHVTEERLRQTLGMLILLNCGLALTQFLAAPLVALWFEQPQVADLLQVQSLLYLGVPFCALPHASLSRKMDFRRPAQVRLAAALAGAATALTGAFSGWGVWTLVAAPMAMLVTEATGMTWAARAPIRPSFHFAGAGHIAGFGGVMTATQLFWFVQSQADVMIAGRVLDAHDLGVYTTGLFLAQLLAAKFVPPINEIAYAAYSRHKVTGPEPLTATIRLVMLVALPAYAGLAVVAPVLVPVLCLLLAAQGPLGTLSQAVCRKTAECWAGRPATLGPKRRLPVSTLPLYVPPWFHCTVVVLPVLAGPLPLFGDLLTASSCAVSLRAPCPPVSGALAQTNT